MGSGSICDTECSVYFHKHTVTMYDLNGRPLLEVWKDNTGAKLWRFSLRPQNFTPFATKEDIKAFTFVPYTAGNSSYLQAFSAYDLLILEALLRYFRSDAGSQTNQCGWMTSSLENFPLRLAWHIKTQPSTSHRLMRH